MARVSLATSEVGSMKLKIAALEVAMLIGICISAVLLPRSFPLTWFIAISMGVLVAANVLLFHALRRNRARSDMVIEWGHGSI
jgi:hypothetical protein